MDNTNYCDSRTDKEREEDAKIKVTMTSTSLAPNESDFVDYALKAYRDMPNYDKKLERVFIEVCKDVYDRNTKIIINNMPCGKKGKRKGKK